MFLRPKRSWAGRAGLLISFFLMAAAIAAFAFVVTQPAPKATGTTTMQGMCPVQAANSGFAPYADDTVSGKEAEPFVSYPSALNARPGRITDENALPGTNEWASIGNYDINSLAAYAGATSVNAGGSVGVHIKSTGTSATARLYRLGYYQGQGARLYATYSAFATPAQPNCTRDSATGLVSCPWASSLTVSTDPSWISGLYLLRIDSNNGFRFFVYFTVRNDSYASKLLVMEPTKTNQAYNRFGGESLYYSANNEGRVRAYKVSFDRPYLGGAGTGGLFSHEHEMIRWLEASGFDVSYISDMDRATIPGILTGHDAYMVMGHDEYWTWEERGYVESALAGGLDMIFASANEAYWNIRLEGSTNGANRVIVGYKEAALDPAPPGTPDTITFRDLGRPENQLIGSNYQSYYDEELYNYPWVAAAPASSWYFDCTGLQPGDRVNNIVGEEWDGLTADQFTPPGIESMAHSMLSSPQGEPLPHDSTIYTTTGGARVFAAGSIFFSWGLMDHSWSNQVFQPAYQSQAADPRIQQLMANIIDRFTGEWNGAPRDCASQTFYKTQPRATRTPMPQVGTTVPNATATRTPTRTPTSIPVFTNTPTAVPSCTAYFVSGDVPKAIPDQGVVTSTLTITGSGTIASLAVTGLSFEHTYASDLQVYLTSPQGIRTALFTNVCGGGVWTAANTGFSVVQGASQVMGVVCPPVQGTYAPEEGSLNVFVGQAAAGTWTLEARDAGQYDTGSVLGWGLRVSYANPCPIGSPTPTSTPGGPPNTPTQTNTLVPATSTATATATRTNTAVPPSATATRTATSLSSTATSTGLPATATRTNTVLVPTATGTATGAVMTPTRTATPTRTLSSTSTRTATATRTATRTATAGATPVCSLVYTSVNVPRNVPDQGVVTSTLAIAEVGTIADIRVVNLGLEHTYASDLQVYLIGPDGTRTTLFTNVCGSGVWTAANTGFSVVRSGSPAVGTTCPPMQASYVAEEGTLNAFAGKASNGVWSLEVRDSGPYDVGSVRSWGLWIGFAGTVCPLGNIWQATATAAVPSATPTRGLMSVSFNDVPAGNPFAEYVRWMAERGYVSGYECGGDGEPCPGTYFRPGKNVTRGQLVKMVVAASEWNMLNPKQSESRFADVPRDSAFYVYVETAASLNVIGGYPCGGAGEPCDGQNRPYFRPGNFITRGQLAKVIALGRGYVAPVLERATFADVGLDHTFAPYVEAIYGEGVVGGYACGGAGEPCDEWSRPYFRPANNASRGQVAKVVVESR